MSWYSWILDFTVVATESTPQWCRALCLHGQGGMVLALQQHLPASAAVFDERQAGLDHLSFRVESRAELLAWEQLFQEQEVDYTPIADAGRGAEVVTFRDPDGIALELFHRPAS